jgi:hypothetical protein
MGGGGTKAHPHSGHAHGLHPAIPGLYMFGGVGCGKTMLMDMFVSTVPPEFKVGGGSTTGHCRAVCTCSAVLGAAVSVCLLQRTYTSTHSSTPKSMTYINHAGVRSRPVNAALSDFAGSDCIALAVVSAF